MIKFLVVDDHVELCEVMKDFFEGRGYEVHAAYRGDEALDLVQKIKPHLVFLDIGLPDISGLDLLLRIKKIDKTVKVIMITAYQDEDRIETAKQRGASDYVVKPFTLEYMQTTVLGKIHNQLFEDLRNEHENLTRVYKKLSQNIVQSIYALARTLEERDCYTRGHSERVSRYASAIAEEMGFSEERIKIVAQAGLLHDIGKIGVVNGILHNPGKLNEEQWDRVKRHPGVGAEILEGVEELREHVLMVRHHHERWDGNGYPDGLKGEKIPLGARIMAVADAYDAMTSDRSYRQTATQKDAYKELVKGKGIQFDPEVVDAFTGVLTKWGIVTADVST